MSAHRPAFVITMDTEGDNLWARRPTLTCHNAGFLPRFQQLAERYGFRPTWLTNHGMATDPVFQRFGHDVLEHGTGEIGMHLHAWDSPPIVPLTADDIRQHPYLIEYSDDLMRAKVDYLTRLLTATFGAAPTSHRAGRWAFDERYARLLVEYGYRVDCSVTPGYSWATQRHGPDYTGFPHHAYWMDLDDIRRPGDSALLQAPMTLAVRDVFWRPMGQGQAAPTPVFRVLNRLCPAVIWLRPNGRNRRHLLAVVEQAKREGWDYLMFMLHSSELMPGGSPTFPDAAAIERLYQDTAALFAAAAGEFVGLTLTEYVERFAAGRHRES